MPQMAIAGVASLSAQMDSTLRLEYAAFGAKVRAARAVLELSQDEFAHHVGLTQNSVHRIAQGTFAARRRTSWIIEQFWRDNGIGFEDLRDGGFRLVVSGPVLLR